MREISRRVSGLFCVATSVALAQSYTISTAVGAGAPSGVAGQSASLGSGVPSFLTADPAGDVFFVDQNSVVKRDATSGMLTVVAGNGTTGYSGDNGPATAAQWNNPQGLAVDLQGNLYIADAGNNVIRVVSGGAIRTIAGNGSAGAGCANGQATSMALNSPGGLAVDSTGNLYVADTGDYCVRRVSNGTMTTVAGNGVPSYSGDGGPATAAELSFILSVAVDSNGNLYIADAGNERVREVSGGVIRTVAGNGSCCTYGGDGGPATNAQLSLPTAVAVDSGGDLFISDTNHNVIREVTGGTIHTIAGDDALGAGYSGDNAAATQAQLSAPQLLAVDGSGNLYIADQGNQRIREVSHGNIATIVGNGSIGDGGPATGAQLGLPAGLGLDPAGNLYIADSRALLVRKVAAATGIITTLAGNGTTGGGIANGSSATSVGLDAPLAVAADSNGNVYIANAFAFTVLEVAAGLISTFAGTGTGGYSGDGGPAPGAEIGNSFGIAADASGAVYFSDDLETNTTSAARVRQVTGGTIHTAAGNGMIGNSGDGGQATSAELNFPSGLAVGSQGDLYIADVYANEIRKVSKGIITRVAGTGDAGSGGDGGPATSAQLNNPGGVAVDANGNVFIADTGNNRVRMVSHSTGLLTTIAGNGTPGFSGDYGPATSAELNSPMDVVVNSAGSVLVADSSGRVRVLTPSGSSCVYGGVPGTLGTPAAGGSEDIAVSTTAFCPWTVSGLPGWITLTGPEASTGAGNASLLIAANPGAARSATITIAGTAVTVTQSAAGTTSPCDINGDGVVDVLDVRLMIKQALGLLVGQNSLSGSGAVNAVDAQIDLNAALKLGCEAKG